MYNEKKIIYAGDETFFIIFNIVMHIKLLILLLSVNFVDFFILASIHDK